MFKFSKNKKIIIVAEISANHGQDFKQAVALIKEARKNGADAVKFQVYTPDTITIDVDKRYFRIKHPKWGGQTLYQLYKKAYTPWEWLKKLKKISDDLGIMFFATAFDKTAIDLLEELNVEVHKIASFELVDLPLIEYAAKTKKPIILSTGMASIREIREAVFVAKNSGALEIALLKCVSSYPSDPKGMNLRVIGDMKKRFKCPIGLSDHSLGIGVSLAAAALGAVMIEKHFTLSRRRKTPDSFFSIEPQELKNLADNVMIIEQALGEESYELTKKQKESLKFRRSLFIVEDMNEGEVYNDKNVRSIRPAVGLSPKYLKNVIGKKAKITIRKGTPLNWSLIGER